MTLFEDILAKYWGYSNFRPLQKKIIQSAYDGKDTLALLPTGGGKSVCFQVPALAKEGLCLVVTPLIALMKDQVDQLKKKNIKAVALHAGLSKMELDIALNNCVYGDYKFLYLSPERLQTDILKTRLQDMNVNLIAVDEAHCISQWGYDFRPSYLEIAHIRDILPKVPVLALTATATPVVTIDIQEKLRFGEQNVIKKSFERKNLSYIVRNTEDKLNYLKRICTRQPGSGIVYVRSRRKTREIAEFLVNHKISADYYHAGLDARLRDLKQYNWQQDKVRIIVATNAFGMGIDKPDVRFVIHLDIPESPEAYFQEAGRGGRDGKRSYAVLLYNSSDIAQLKRERSMKFPERDQIKSIYQSLCNHYQIAVGAGKGLVVDFNLLEFSKKYRLNHLIAFNSLKILEKSGYIELTEEVDSPSKILFTIKRDDLYKFQVANAKYDGIIKLLLRSYSGLFNDYIKIDEAFLAKKAHVSTEIIIEYLKRLKQFGVISYIKQKRTPYVIFTAERLDNKSLFISQEDYEKRKEAYFKRVQAMINYSEDKDSCRSQMLLQYFGEDKAKKCGYCDVCTRKNEIGLSQYEFELILQLLRTKLQKRGYVKKDLIDEINLPSEKTIRVIEWMIENKYVCQDSHELIIWNIQKEENDPNKKEDLFS